MNAAEQAALVRAGELSARELVEAALAAIDERDGELNAFVHRCDDRALAEADTIAPGDSRPLCGVPIALKDLISATEGLPTTHGTHAFGDWVADHDTAHVRRLREAGAIVVGKTASPELGLRPLTESARYGVTRNPLDPALSPGGSSGGSAAAVAAGMVAIGEGSDLGGSLRIPASCCGLVALKPSRGRVSIGPDFADITLGAATDGVITGTVADSALALSVIAGYEPGDHHWLPEITEQASERVTVRVAEDAPFGIPVDAEPRAAAAHAARLLAEAGHDVTEQAPDWNDETFLTAWPAFVTGSVRHLVRALERLHGQAMDPAKLEPATREWIVDGPAIGLVDYLEAHEQLGAYTRRLLRGWPPGSVLVTPTLTRLPAPAGEIAASAGVTDLGTRFSAFVRIWNVTGQPAITVPVGGVGVQIVGPPGRDDLVLAVAAQLEEAAVRTPTGTPAGRR